MDIVDKHNKSMGIVENWAHGERTTGRYKRDNKKVYLFMKIRTSVNLYRLKQRIRETCREEKLWMYRNNSELEHIKRIDMLVGECIPHELLERF